MGAALDLGFGGSFILDDGVELALPDAGQKVFMPKKLILIFFLFSSTVFAKEIRIEATPRFKLQVTKKGLLIQGNYSMLNSGDEVAKNVFPRLSLDLFEISGKPKDLNPQEQNSWDFKEEIPFSKLCTTKIKNCPVALPLAGQILVNFENNYSDANLYPFAIPQLTMLALKTNTKDESPAVQVKMALKIKRIQGDQYQADYEVHNQLSEDIELKLDALLPREMELLTPLSPLRLKEKASLFGSFHFKNQKGLQGSRYYAYVTAQWENAGLRKSAWVYAPFSIGMAIEKEPAFYSRISKTQIFWTLWGAIAILGFALIWRFWVLPLRGMRPK
jgi:hypothetical protein